MEAPSVPSALLSAILRTGTHRVKGIVRTRVVDQQPVCGAEEKYCAEKSRVVFQKQGWMFHKTFRVLTPSSTGVLYCYVFVAELLSSLRQILPGLVDPQCGGGCAERSISQRQSHLGVARAGRRSSEKAQDSGKIVEGENE